MILREDIEKIHANLDKFSIDEIREIIHPYQDGLEIVSPLFGSGSFFYRGSFLGDRLKKSNPIKISDLSYPKVNVTLQRANRENSPVFYCSDRKEVIFYELNVKAGDEFILSIWKTTDRLLVNSVGHTEETFKKMGASRPCPQWGAPRHNNGGTFNVDAQTEKDLAENLKQIKKVDTHSELREFHSREFTREDKEHYKLTTAIAEQYLGEVEDSDFRFGGIIFPTVRMGANGDNLAILPWYADNHLVFTRAAHIKVTARNGNEISYDEIDYATEVDKNDHIIWKGGTASWNVPPGVTVAAKAVAGPDSFGNYLRGKNGEQIHWEVRDNEGNFVHPA